MSERFLRNCWYLAAWSDELAPGAMLARRIAGEHLLLLRGSDGSVAALADACPHRFAPLSRGTCDGTAITCAYHGLRFAFDGRCIGNPHGPVTRALTVPAFPLVERHQALWTWLGERPADPATIPDFSFIDRAAPAARVKGHLNSPADYRLMIDNIMDLTHADYLHASSLGGGINTRAAAEVTQDGGTVSITWTARDDRLAPLHTAALPGCSGRGDMLNRVDWFAPGTMRQRILLALPGELDRGGVDSMTCHVMTPEAPGRTHYFFCHTSDAVSANPAIAPAIREALVAAFAGEDAPMLAAQTERVAGRDFWSLRPALLPSDKGAVLARRALDALIAGERAESQA